MTKRLILLLTLAAIVLVTAPVATADHCFRCSSSPTGTPLCVPTTSVGGGFPQCTVTATSCVLSGTRCPIPHGFADAPLAADFTVAAVVRLDEPEPPADETRVASLEMSPATR